MDIVYFVSPQARQNELIYSLRSLRNAPEGRVALVGHLPKTVDPSTVLHIPTVQDDRNKRENVMRGWLAMLAHPELSESVVVMNDDFFVMREIAGWPDPNHWWGSYADWRAKHKEWGPTRQANTKRAMDFLGTPQGDQVSAELHVPLVVHRQTMRDILLILQANDFPRAEIFPRSIYVSATTARAGQQMADIKVHGNEEPIPRGDYLSTSDGSFAYCWVGRVIRSKFMEPSPFER